MTTFVENKDLIDRKTASRLLKVSIRTLDRYRQNGQVATRIIDNKIYLSKSEILEFIARQNEQLQRQSRQEKNAKMSRDTKVDNAAHSQDTGAAGLHQEARDNDGNTYTFVDAQHVSSGSHREVESHERELNLIDTYKTMYEEISTELRRRQEELEAAHYRIGQLEGQLRYSVPLPEHKSEILRLTESTQHLEQDIMEKQLRLKKVREAYHYEKLNKRIYLFVVLGLLALQPLWLYLA